MNTDELAQKLHAGSVDEIVIESMEGDIYLIRPSVGGVADVLIDEQGRLSSYQSLNAAKTQLRELGSAERVPLYFRHSVAHDEMMGSSNETADDRMPITLEGQSQ